MTQQTSQQIPTEAQVKEILKRQLNEGKITTTQAAAKMSNFRKLQSGQEITPTNVAGQAFQQPQSLPKPTLGEQVKGQAQAVGGILTGALAEPIAGLSGLAVGGITGDAGQAAGTVEAVQQFASDVVPTNRVAEQRLEQFGQAVQGGVNLFNKALSLPFSGETEKNIQEKGVSDTLGDAVLEATGNPELAAIAFSLPTAIIEGAGFKGVRNLKGQSVFNAEKQFLANNPKVAIAQASPEIKQLKDKANTLYKEIDEAGAVVDQNDYLNFAIDIGDTSRKMGFDPRVSQQLTPKAQALLQLVEDDLGGNITFGKLDQTRRLAAIAAGQIDNPVEKAIGTMVIEKIDNFLDGQAVKIDAVGDTALSGKYREARNLWSRAKRSEVLDDIVAGAQEQASGFENGLRIGFRSLLKNKKKLRGFKPAEIELMREISQGTTLANTTKKLGKLGFGDNQQTNMLMFSLGGGAGFAAGGPFGAVAIPTLGTVSGKLATQLTANKSTLLNSVVKAGDNGLDVTKAYLKNTPPKDRSISDLTELLMNTNVDLEAMKKAPLSQLAQDAVFAAERFKSIGAANLIEVPAIIQSNQQEEQQ